MYTYIYILIQRGVDLSPLLFWGASAKEKLIGPNDVKDKAIQQEGNLRADDPVIFPMT